MSARSRSLLLSFCVSSQWGSLYKLTPHRLPAFVINGDPDGLIGQSVQRALVPDGLHDHRNSLDWRVVPQAKYPTDQDVVRALKTDEVAWVVVQIMNNASQALLQAQQIGNSSWNPNSVIQIWYSSARNYLAVPGHIVGPTKGLLVNTMNQLNENFTSTWLDNTAAAGSNNQSLITAALNLAEQAPQAIGHAVDFEEHDVNPFNQTVTVATTFVGLIYILLLSFNITMAFCGTRQPILPFLRLGHLIYLRIALPLVTYLLVSLIFSMVNLPFHARFSALGPNTAAGFFAFFALMFTGMVVLGLSTEFALELLGPKFVAFGLMFLVILNVSGAQYPIQMLNPVYRVSYILPFYNLRTAFIKILYDQGKNISVFIHWVILAAWVVVLLALFPFLIIRDQRKAIAMRKAARAGGGPGGTESPPGPPSGPPSGSSGSGSGHPPDGPPNESSSEPPIGPSGGNRGDAPDRIPGDSSGRAHADGMSNNPSGERPP